jgi:hypothetical protein
MDADEATVAPYQSREEDDPAVVSASVSESDFECALCCNLYFDPITTDCGHTVCRICLIRSLEVKQQCPLCRQSLTIDATSHPTTTVLANLIQRLFPQTYAARKEESFVETTRRVKAPRYGIFQSHSPIFPGAPIQLHIFEPRYRVMINRALLSSRAFILLCKEDQPIPDVPMLGANPEGEGNAHPAAIGGAAAAPVLGGGGVHFNDPLRLHLPFDAPIPPPPVRITDGSVGCLVRILRCQAHADGRSFVEAVGGQRVRVVGVREEDEAAFGLLSAEVRVIEDVPEAEADAQQPVIEEADPAASIPAGEPVNENIGSEETKEDGGGLRQRRNLDGSAPTSDGSISSDSATSSSSIDAPVAPITVPALLAECRHLLSLYAEACGCTLERLQQMNGGGHIPENAQPAEFSWWILRLLPDAQALKQQALITTNVRDRLHICAEILRYSVENAKKRSGNQVKFVAILCLSAIVMILMRQYNLTD